MTEKKRRRRDGETEMIRETKDTRQERSGKEMNKCTREYTFQISNDTVHRNNVHIIA